MTGKVCVFGAFNVDVVARLSRFPRPGESMIAAMQTWCEQILGEMAEKFS